MKNGLKKENTAARKNLILFLQHKAQAGYYKDAGPHLIKTLLKEIKAAKFPIPEAQDFLIHALNQIIKGASADKAFLLKGNVSGHGRKRLALEERDREIAYEVFIRTHAPHIHGLQKIDIKKARITVAKLFDVKEATVKKAYELHRASLLKEFSPFIAVI